MKRLIMICTLLAGMAGAVYAQPREKGMHGGKKMTPEQQAEKQTQRMEQSLNLTAEQKQAIYNANLDAAKKMDPYREDIRQHRKAIGDVRQAREARYKEVLSADQYSRYEQMKAERRKQMAARSAEHRQKPNPAR